MSLMEVCAISLAAAPERARANKPTAANARVSLAKTLSDEAGQERRGCRAGVVWSSNGGPSGEGAERIFASRRESTRSTPPVEPEVFDPWVAPIATSGRRAVVAMVQAAHLGERDDLALRTLHWSWFRGIFVQAQMGPTAVVIFEVGFEQALQVSLIEHDNVVQTLATDRAHQPFDVRRLPG